MDTDNMRLEYFDTTSGQTRATTGTLAALRRIAANLIYEARRRGRVERTPFGGWAFYKGGAAWSGTLTLWAPKGDWRDG